MARIGQKFGVGVVGGIPSIIFSEDVDDFLQPAAANNLVLKDGLQNFCIGSDFAGVYFRAHYD